MIKGAVAFKAAVFFIIDEVAVAMILFESLKIVILSILSKNLFVIILYIYRLSGFDFL